MRFINLFVASSIIEFERERIYIGDHIRRLNDRSYDEGYYVKLYLCEDDSENLQSTYDRKIENSDIFIALIGEKLGEKTKHELYVANHSDNILSRHIIIDNECNPSIIPNELLTSFNIHVIKVSNLEILFDYIDSCINSIVSQIADTHYLPAKKLFSLNIPNHNDSFELAMISNIIRGFKDRYEDELQLIISNSVSDIYNAYLSLLSENQNCEYERLLRITNDENLRNSIWLFENAHYSSESTKEMIGALYEFGIYHITYRSNDELKLSFRNKLSDALKKYKSFVEVKYIIENHIIYEVSQRTHKRHVVKNLLSTHIAPEIQGRLEQNIVNITNLYIVTNQFDKLNESLIKLEDSDFDYFIYNPDIISPDLPFTDYYKTLVKYVYDSIEYLNYHTINYTGKQIQDKLCHILHIIAERGILLKPTEKLTINYLCGKLLLSYNEPSSAKEHYIKAYEAYQEGTLNNSVYMNYIKDIIIDLCEIFFELNDYKQILTWVDNGKKLVGTNDIAYKVKLLVCEARGHGDYNPTLASELYNTALSILIERDLYKQFDDLLNLYIIISFEVIFDKYRSLSDNDTEQINQLDKQTLALDMLYERYLSNSNFWLSKVYILYLQGLLNLNMEDCLKGDIILNSHPDKRINDGSKRNLEYIKALIYKRTHKYKESNEILSKIVKEYKGPKSQASCFQIMGTNYSYMYESKEALSCAVEFYEKALELDASLGSKIHDGLSYCCLMTKDFKKAEEHAYKALQKDNVLNDNKYANYITSLLCQNKYIKAFTVYAIKCKSNQNIKRILKEDWEGDLRELGINTSRFPIIFTFDKDDK